MLALFRRGNYDGGMIMALSDDWVNVEKAADLAGCSPQFLRRELEQHLDPATGESKGGRVVGWRLNGKAWLVSRASAVALGPTLSTRARSRKAERQPKAAEGRKRPRPAGRPKPRKAP
jgi:hypothetical protein